MAGTPEVVAEYWPDGRRRWAVVATVIGPLRVLRLTSDALEEHRGEKVRRLPLANVRRIETEWVPYSAPVIRFAGRSVRIEWGLSEESAEFVREIGRALAPRMMTVHASKSGAKAMGWPDHARWG